MSQNYHTNKSKLKGSISLPPSKSQSLRAILFARLASTPSTLENLLDSPDTNAAFAACKNLGTDQILDVGNSGILLRFLSAIAALGSTKTVITGDASIQKRPMQDLLYGLNQLGVKTEGQFAPVTLTGPIKGGRATLSGHDSQAVSALLIAAAFAKAPTELIVTNPGEIPWVALTLSWFDRLGIKYENENFRRYYIPGSSAIEGFKYVVPADLSSLSFPLAAAAITESEITVENIDMNEPQGDKKFVDILKDMGADIRIKGTSLTFKPSHLKAIDVDINDCIDIIAPLAVVGCFAKGKTKIYNASVAREKECDRIKCLTLELSKMGADIEERDDGLEVSCSPLHGALVSSYKDHRMAMALAVAGFGAKGETVVADVACVNKTFPGFKETFLALGANIYLINLKNRISASVKTPGVE